MRTLVVVFLVSILLLPAVAAQAPEQIHTSLGASAADQDLSPPDAMHLVVQWTVDGEVISPPDYQPVARYSINNGSQATVAGFLAGSSRDYDVSVSGSCTEGCQVDLYYAARIPAARGANVTYSVGDDGGTFSDEFTVQLTHLRPDKNLRVAAMANIGYEGYDRNTKQRLPSEANYGEQVVLQARNRTPDLVIIPGDLGSSSSTFPWDIHMNLAEPLYATVPTMPTLGDSDDSDDAAQFRNRWVLPSTVAGSGVSTTDGALGTDAPTSDEAGFFYGFSAGSAYFIALDSLSVCTGEAIGDVGTCDAEGPDPEQIDWMKETFEDVVEDLQPEWIVVYTYFGPHMHSDDGPHMAVKQYWAPIWEAWGVDLVLYGQEQIYQRSYPLQNGVPMSDDLHDYPANLGTVYVSTGAGGGFGFTNEAGPEPWPPWLAASNSTYQFTQLDITNRTLDVQSISHNGTLLDSFKVHKPGSPGYEASKAAVRATDGPAGDGEDSPGLPLLLVVVALAGLARLRRHA